MDSVANIILYFVVAICMTVFSVMAVTSRRILRAATYLLFVLISTSVIYFQLGYEFLGAVQIAVYAGGYNGAVRVCDSSDPQTGRHVCPS